MIKIDENSKVIGTKTEIILKQKKCTPNFARLLPKNDHLHQTKLFQSIFFFNIGLRETVLWDTKLNGNFNNTAPDPAVELRPGIGVFSFELHPDRKMQILHCNSETDGCFGGCHDCIK